MVVSCKVCNKKVCDRQATQAAFVRLSRWLSSQGKTLAGVFMNRSTIVKDEIDLWKTIYDSGLTQKDAKLVLACVDLNGDGSIECDEIDCVIANIRRKLNLNHRKALPPKELPVKKQIDHTFPDWLFKRDDFRCFLIGREGTPFSNQKKEDFEQDVDHGGMKSQIVKNSIDEFDDDTTIFSTNTSTNVNKQIIRADLCFTASRIPKQSAFRLGRYALSTIGSDPSILSKDQIIELGRRVLPIHLDQGDPLPSTTAYCCNNFSAEKKKLVSDKLIVFDGKVQIQHDRKEKIGQIYETGQILPRLFGKEMITAIVPQTILLMIPSSLIFTLRKSRVQHDSNRIFLILKECFICRGASSLQLHETAAHSSVLHFDQKTRIFSEGTSLFESEDHLPALYIVLSGTIALCRRLVRRQKSRREKKTLFVPPTELTLRYIQQTDTFGEEALLSSYTTHAYSAVVISDTAEILRIPINIVQSSFKPKAIYYHCQMMLPLYQDEVLLFSRHKSLALRDQTLQHLLKDALHGSKYLARCSAGATACNKKKTLPESNKHFSSISTSSYYQQQQQESGHKIDDSFSENSLTCSNYDYDDSSFCAFDEFPPLLSSSPATSPTSLSNGGKRRSSGISSILFPSSFSPTFHDEKNVSSNPTKFPPLLPPPLSL